MTTRPHSPHLPEPTTFRARSTDDLVALAPIAIGFHPERSVVMLTFGGPRPFHARVDLPDDPGDVDLVVATLLAPARRHRVEKVAFLIYAADGPLVTPLAAELRDGFQVSGVDVLDVVRVAGDQWFALLPGHPDEHYDGVSCAPGTHPFAARAVVGGHVTLGSREEVRRTIEPDPDGVRRSREVLSSASARPLTAARVAEVVRCGVETGAAGDTDVVGLALAVRHGAVRDVVWSRLDRSAAPVHVDFWRAVVRRLPEELVASPAAVLAFCAWLAGDGALAWCAVDRAEAADPGHSLARLVADLLTTATPPGAWATLQGGVGHADGVGDVA